MCLPDCCDPNERPRATEVTPYDKRSCTDILFIFLFLAFWVAIAAIVGKAAALGGDAYKIIHASDWNGQVCGIDASVKSTPYGAWPDPLGASDIKVCVADCNATQTWNFTVKYNTKALSYFCLPLRNLTSNLSVTLGGSFEDADQTASRAMGDMYTAWPVIFVSGFFALAIAFFYCWLARKLAGCMVWTIIIFMAIGGFLIGYALLSAAKEAEDSGLNPKRAQVMNALGIACVVITFLFLITVFAMRKRIEIAIDIVEEAARAIEQVPQMVFFPIGPFFVGVAFFVVWIVISLLIFSVSLPVSTKITSSYIQSEFSSYPGFNGNYTDLQWDTQLKDAFAIHFFWLLWVEQFLIYWTYLVIAGSIATWYFTRYDNDGNKNVPPGIMVESVARACRFHLGSVALGSLILAFIHFVRAMLRYLELATKTTNPNRFQICIFHILQCCLKCVECCCDKINKNGYVWMAIFGHSFVPSVCNSWMLIWRNLVRVAAVHLVGEYVLFCGKVIVTLITTGLCGIIIRRVYGDQVTSIAMPCFVIFVLSWMVAHLFMALFDTTIDSIFLCFLIDEEMNKASGQMFANPSLTALVDKHATSSQEMAQQHFSYRQQKIGQAAPQSVDMPQQNTTVTTSAPSGGFVGGPPPTTTAPTAPSVY